MFQTQQEKCCIFFLITEGIIIKFRLTRWKHGNKCHITGECCFRKLFIRKKTNAYFIPVANENT